MNSCLQFKFLSGDKKQKTLPSRDIFLPADLGQSKQWRGLGSGAGYQGSLPNILPAMEETRQNIRIN